MKVCFIPEVGNSYKANLHCHSTLSDGKLTPERIKEIYKAHGYSIVAFTDHEIIYDNSHLTDDGFLAITGCELAAVGPGDTGVPGHFPDRKCVHINLLAPDAHAITNVCYDPEWSKWCDKKNIRYTVPYYGEVVKRENTTAWVNRVISEAEEHGYLVALNHPVWSAQNYDDYKGYKGLWGLEVFNSGCNRLCLTDTTVVYDQLLRLGNTIFPIAADDNHGGEEHLDKPSGDMCRGWTVVKAGSLDYQTIFAALKNGDFYASTGPEIKSAYAEDGVIHIECSDVRRIWVNSSSSASLFAYPENEGETISSADFVFASKDEEGKWISKLPGYVRITVEDVFGRQAWTKAILVEDLLR